MTRMKLAVFAIATAAMLVPVAGVQANEIEQARATVQAIDQDRGAANEAAGYFYREAGKAQERMRWHSWMIQARGEQMNRSGCMRPSTTQAWNYCMALYTDMQEHARRRQYLTAVIQDSRGRHMAAVQHLAMLDQAGQAWRTHLATLTSNGPAYAGGQANGIQTGSIDAAR